MWRHEPWGRGARGGCGAGNADVELIGQHGAHVARINTRFRVSRRAWGTWTDFGCSTFIRPPVGAVSTCLGAGRATTVTVCNYEETPLFADRLTSYYAMTRGNQAAEDGGSTDGRALRCAARIRDDTGTRQRMRGAGRCTGSGSRWPQPRARAPGQLTASGPKAIGREQLFDH
jgi:hypothetical protein